MKKSASYDEYCEPYSSANTERLAQISAPLSQYEVFAAEEDNSLLYSCGVCGEKWGHPDKELDRSANIRMLVG